MLGCKDRALATKIPYEDITDLSTIYNPLGPHTDVLKSIEEAIYKPFDIAGINRYPNFLQNEIISSIAKFWNVSKESITPGCGTSEIINMVSAAFLRGAELVISTPDYEVMHQKAKDWGAKMKKIPLSGHKIDLDRMIDAVSENTKLIYVSNPHNPTGSYIKKSDIEIFFESVWSKNKNVIVYVDEAHGEYLDENSDYPKCVEYTDTGKILVSRTFSKFYGLAGLRAGYLIAHPDITRITRGNFAASFFGGEGEYFGWQHFEANISRLAEAGLIKALETHSEQKTRVQNFLSEIYPFVKSELEKRGFEYIEPSAGFISINIGKNSKEVSEKLIEYKIAVKPLSGDYKDWIRITIAPKDVMKRVLETLFEVVK